jgi:hypothetical protein
MGEMTEQHRGILERIGEEGASPESLGRVLNTREFDDLRSDGLVVYWHERASRPTAVVGFGYRPGTWMLTFAGASAIGLEIPLLRTA